MTNLNTTTQDDRHIGFYHEGKMYYLPSLFHMAPTHERIVPLTVRDVVRAKNVLQIYGVQGLEKHNQGYVMVNNYPVKVVKIAGRLLSYAFKSFDEGGIKSKNNFYLFHIDDCSGERLMICVKIQELEVLFRPNELHEGLLVEVTGTVHYTQIYDKQLLGRTAKIIGEASELDVEIAWWKRVLDTRRLLQSPWTYVPEEPIYFTMWNPGGIDDAPERNIEQKEPEYLVLSSEYDDPFNSDINPVDSISLERSEKHNHRHNVTRSEIEVIDLTLDINSLDSSEELPILTSFHLASFSRNTQESQVYAD